MYSQIIWILKFSAWLLRTFWIAALTPFLVMLGADFESGLDILFGSNWQDPAFETLLKWVPPLLYIIATAALAWSLFWGFRTESTLKASLHESISGLHSDNLMLRVLAIEEILEISRQSVYLNARAIDSLATFLRQCHPALSEPGRNVTMRKQRFGAPSAKVSQSFEGSIHDFAQKQYALPVENLSPDAAAVVDALIRRRRFLDDPRKWVDLSFTNLPSAIFEGGNFKRFVFIGANLRHARFVDTCLYEASFDGAILNDAFFTGSNATKTSFSGIMGHRAHFDKAKLRSASFLGADLYDASIQKANAQDAQFMVARMWRVSAGLTDFSGACFSNANLCGADLRASKGLTHVQILGNNGVGQAQIDKNTKLPWSTEEQLRKAGTVHLKP